MLSLLPTDTCYGLAGEFSEEDYHAIYRLKGRDFTKQLALLVEDYDDMKNYIEISDEQREFLKNYPHPWSYLGKRQKDFMLPEWMDRESYQMISLRVARVCIPPFHLSTFPPFHFPLFLTSANRSWMSETKTLAEAGEVFPGVDGVDGGICDHPPSDIFSLDSRGELVYLRRNY